MNKNKHIVVEGSLGDEMYVEDPDLGGYTAFFKDFPQMVTQGETIEEAQENLWKLTYDVFQYLLKTHKNFDITNIKNVGKN